MSLTLNLPNREDTLAFHRQRWSEVVCDPAMADRQERIETNAFGQIVMSPPPMEPHSDRQGEITFQLRRRLGGHAKPECPVITSDGVKALDVGWYSDGRHALVRGQVACEIAPEICVEIFSPSNTAAEMRHKRRLYFDAGALECWVCDTDGHMHYYLDTDPDTAHPHSRLCPDFPTPVNP